MGDKKDAAQKPMAGGRPDWHDLLPALLTFAVALGIALVLSLILAAVHGAVFGGSFPDLFDTYFQGLAALGALGAVAYELKRDARLRKEEEKSQLAKEEDFYNRKKFDEYYREACLVTAYEAAIVPKDAGVADNRDFNYLVIENRSSGSIADYSWEFVTPGDAAVKAGPGKDKTWKVLPQGRWLIKYRPGEGFDWFFPQQVSAEGEVVFHLFENDVRTDIQGDIFPYSNPGKNIQIKSLTFTDAFGNTWAREYGGPAEGHGQAVLVSCPDAGLWDWYTRRA